MRESNSNAELSPEALALLRRFAGEVVVVKYGGSFMDSQDPAVRGGVARDVVAMAAAGILPVLVHGGGKAITAALAATGAEARFIQGMRVTDEAAAQVVERVLSREINPQIVAMIKAFGGKAKGFSGAEIFNCRKLWLSSPDGARLDAGFVGEVVSVNTAPLLQCLKEGVTPVVSPTARGGDGRVYNCNADVAAAEAAMALQARRLVFMSDVPGLLRDPKNPLTIIPVLRAGEVEALKKSGVIDKGMIPKMESAVKAARAGVSKVLLVDGRVARAALAGMISEASAGTEIVTKVSSTNA
jgi:acetylglutamate kinase